LAGILPLLPAWSRSAACAALCALSMDTMAGESGTVRRDRGDFGSVITNAQF
jgi:hypothetical protein